MTQAIESVIVLIMPRPGTTYWQIAREALKIAVDEWRIVEFWLNDTKYRVSPNDLVSSITGGRTKIDNYP